MSKIFNVYVKKRFDTSHNRWDTVKSVIGIARVTYIHETYVWRFGRVERPFVTIDNRFLMYKIQVGIGSSASDVLRFSIIFRLKFFNRPNIVSRTSQTHNHPRVRCWRIVRIMCQLVCYKLQCLRGHATLLYRPAERIINRFSIFARTMTVLLVYKQIYPNHYVYIRVTSSTMSFDILPRFNPTDWTSINHTCTTFVLR